MLDEGFLAEVRAKTVQQEREEVYPAFIGWWKDCEELKPKQKKK